VPPAEAQGKGRPSPSAPTPAAPSRPSKGKGKGKQAAAQKVVSPAGVNTGAKCASHFAAAEWTSAAKLTSPTQIRKALENGDPDLPGNVVLTRDPKILSELQDIWSAYAVTHPLTVGLKVAQASSGSLVSVWWNGTSKSKTLAQKVKFELTQLGSSSGPVVLSPGTAKLVQSSKIKIRRLLSSVILPPAPASEFVF
jgi:hypothetical protein